MLFKLDSTIPYCHASRKCAYSNTELFCVKDTT